METVMRALLKPSGFCRAFKVKYICKKTVEIAVQLYDLGITENISSVEKESQMRFRNVNSSLFTFSVWNI